MLASAVDKPSGARTSASADCEVVTCADLRQEADLTGLAACAQLVELVDAGTGMGLFERVATALAYRGE